MFIDYVSLMLINMAAGFFILAYYVSNLKDAEHLKEYSSSFFIIGAVATLCGLHMTWTWPLPGSYNAAFGELSVLFGVLFLGAGLALAKEWDLMPLGIYAVFAGIAAVVVGFRIINFKLTQTWLISGIGFILSGISGIMAPLILKLRANKAVRLISAIGLIITSLLWARIGYMAYWGHMESFSKWIPATMVK